MGHMVAESFLSRHADVITAIASVVVALLAAWALDRALTRAYARRPQALRDPRLDTRLRFLRRVVEASIVLLGIAVALSQFTALDRVAASVLASGAIAAAIIGFAARQTIANAVAGMMLALTQPLRIGDLVTFEDQTGTVVDVRLTTTHLQTAAGARIIVPNERLAGGVLRNDTLGGPTTTAEASIWLPRDADGPAALAVLRTALPDHASAIAETTPEGIRLTVARADVPTGERLETEAGIRHDALAAIAAGGRTPQG